MQEIFQYKDYPILFVDAEASALIAFKDLFKEEFTVYTANTSAEALQFINDHPDLALIISDQEMPDMNGVELLQRIAEKHPDTVRMLITAYKDMERVRKTMNEGEIYRYIAKPYNVDELTQTLIQGIERYYLMKERDLLYAEKMETLNKIARTHRLTAIGTLAAGMAHEINNPLVAIKTFLQMIPEKYDEAKKDSEFWVKFYNVALGETQRIQQLISRLLHYSKNPEEETLDLRRIDINLLIEETITLLDNEAKKKGLKIQRNLSPDLPACVADHGKLRQVFLNIMLNSIQGTEQGHILISTSLGKDEVDQNRVNIIVEDTGIGISEENIGKLFKPFFTTKRNEGSGLGLMMCLHIIEEHRGLIDVQSELGKGTKVSVLVPLDPTSYNRRRGESPPPQNQ
ncbi:MAG: ATP-binding protein [Nitrospira sp.]|nr:hybrid sensor histidine kinase/response regulator [Candidatus Manganitrophaceae bacterium]HIL33908.1 hybrid sensor histidine kinase/response regulator [Candidatus Manganitrophaceae bacterium]